jgi:HD-like signal output (HDOD) protein
MNASVRVASSPNLPGLRRWTEWVETNEWEEYLSVLPMLPVRAHELVSIAMDPHVAPNRLAAIVVKDPVLATRVLRVANSAQSCPGREIVSVFEATVRLGTGPIRRILASACVTSMVTDSQVYGRGGRDLVDHSLGTAYLSWLIANASGVPADEAFLHGLLHDVGKLVILKLAKIWRPGVARPDEQELAALMVARHAEFGGHFIRSQRMPESLIDPVVWHHSPQNAKDPRAATVVYAANRLAHRYGFGCTSEVFEPLEDQLLVQAGLDAPSLARLDSHAPPLFEVARRAVG